MPDGNFIPAGRGVSAGNGWRWIADAWAFTGQQRGTFIGVLLLYMLVVIVLNLVGIVGSLICLLLLPVIKGGFLLGCDTLRRGGRLEVGHLFAGFQRHAGKLLTIGAISLAVGIVVVLVMFAVFGAAFGEMFLGGGLPSVEEFDALLLPLMLVVLIIIALSLPLYMATWFAVPLIVFGESDVVPALKTSFFACLKNVLPFLVWSLAILWLGILGAIPLFLGWLLLAPVAMASIYLSYRDIFYDI